jgi:hypothetical protein
MSTFFKSLNDQGLPLWVWSLMLAAGAAILLRYLIRSNRAVEEDQSSPKLTAATLLATFLAATVAVVGLVAALIAGFSDTLVDVLAREGFLGLSSSSGFSLGDEAFVGLLAIVAGVPVSIAGSAVAIYLAYSSLHLSRAQNELQRQANRIEDPEFQSARSARDSLFRLDLLLGVLLAQRRRDAMDDAGAGTVGENLRDDLLALFLNPDAGAVFQEIAQREDQASDSDVGHFRADELPQILANCLAHLPGKGTSSLRPELFIWTEKLGQAYQSRLEFLKGAQKKGPLENWSARVRYFAETVDSFPRFKVSGELNAVKELMADRLGMAKRVGAKELTRYIVECLAQSSLGGRATVHRPEPIVVLIDALVGDLRPTERVMIALKQHATRNGVELATQASPSEAQAGRFKKNESLLPVFVLRSKSEFDEFVRPKTFHGISRAAVIVDPFKDDEWADVDVSARISDDNPKFKYFVEAFLDKRLKDWDDVAGTGIEPAERELLVNARPELIWFFVRYQKTEGTSAQESPDEHSKTLHATIQRNTFESGRHYFVA